jgi:hypothetical protein
MEKSSFEYFFLKDERFVAGLDIDLFYRSLRCNKRNDSTSFIVRETDLKRLEVSFENTQKSKKVTDLLLLKSIKETIITDQIRYPAPIEMDSSEFQAICREMASFGATKLKIETHNNELIFSNTDGEPKRRQSVNILDKIGKKTLPQNGVFLLYFLKPFSKASNLSQKMWIYLKTNHPLTLEYSIDNLGTHLGTLKYLLAPDEVTSET